MKISICSLCVLTAVLCVIGCQDRSDMPPEIREFSTKQMDQILAEIEKAQALAKRQATARFPDQDALGNPIRGNAQQRRTEYYRLAGDAARGVAARWGVTLTQISLMDQYRSEKAESAQVAQE